MPLSEFYQASVRGEFDSAQSKMANRSSNVSSLVPDNEFAELLWENGPVVMQGKSNRPRKTSIATTNFSSPADRVEGKDSAAINMSKMGQLEAMDSFVSDFSPSDPSGNDRMSTQFDNMVPWINYTIEDPVTNDYCSDFFSEFSGVAMPANGNNGFGHSTKDSANAEHGSVSKALADGSDPSRTDTSQVYRSSKGYQSSFRSITSRMEDLGTGGGSNSQQGMSGNLLGARLPKQDLATSKPHQVGSSMDSVNFSHFSRPGMQAKAYLQSVDHLRSNENSATAASSNRIESTVIQSSGGLHSTSGVQVQLSTVSSMLEMGSSAKTSQQFVSVEQLDVVCEEDIPRKNLNDDITKSNLRSPDGMNNHQSSDLAAGVCLGRSGIEKDHEPIVASSSVCSRNTAGATSNDPQQSAKRKNQEGEESDNHIEDLEDASVGIKKPDAVKGRNAKRSRAAEVHNLSERRRRDRINEKMRALQELIPNCSKVDKASMLDEAIEYLKTLQLQVQMMSMGSGLCMPPMMLPSGMQHMCVPPVAHFSHMGVGMGMNLRFNYGMGMLGMNGSPGCPLIPAPPMHGTQFPCSAVQGAHGLYGMPRPTNLPMFAQGLPISVPHVPPLTSMSGLSTNSNSMPEASTIATNPLEAPDTAPSSISKDQKDKSLNLELLQKTSADDSQGTKESSQQCLSNQTSSTSEYGTVN